MKESSIYSRFLNSNLEEVSFISEVIIETTRIANECETEEEAKEKVILYLQEQKKRFLDLEIG